MQAILPETPLLVVLFVVLATAACEQPRANTDRSTTATAQSVEPVHVLTIGGGSSHDFDRWFSEEDRATLEAAGAVVGYTDAPSQILGALDTLDVLRITNNQPLPGSDIREGIFRFVESGKGLVIGHAGAWYNWEDWPEYNNELIGGGSRSHREYGGFEVQIVAPDHPVVAGVPATFSIEDELYRFQPDPEGSAIEVVATAEEVETGEVYPIIWTVEHPNGRIVVNTLGHDGAAHEHAAYKQILQNSVYWAAHRAQ